MLKLIVIQKRWVVISIQIIVLISIGIVIKSIYYKTQQTWSIPGTAKVIVIDPGHGGIDPGAVGRIGKHEKEINLAIALYLREYLEQSGSIVIMTREDDRGLYTEGGSVRKKKVEDLKNRKIIVEKSNADVFISIHLNSFPQSQYYGAQTFYPKNNIEGKRLATIIQEEFRKTLDSKNKRVPLQKEGVYLIENLEIPTALVECGFMSNPREEQLLNTADYQKKIAWAIYMGLQRFFQEE